MIAVVDTPVWSLALRRTKLAPAEIPWREELGQLIFTELAVLIGPVRQELLSGVADARQFQSLQSQLRGFEDTPLVTHDFELAAEFSNHCRRRGIQGSPTDYLICAVARRLEGTVFTKDGDFRRFAEIVGVGLHPLAEA